MPQAAAQIQPTAERTPKVQRGIREGMLSSTRSNVGPAQSFDTEAQHLRVHPCDPEAGPVLALPGAGRRPAPALERGKEQLVIAGAEGLDDLIGSSTAVDYMDYLDGRLWQVRSPLTTAGSTTLQLVYAKKADASVDGEDVAIYVAGDAGAGQPVVALASAGVLRRSDLVSVDGNGFRVGTPTIWPAGDLRRFLLTPAYALRRT